MTLERPARDHPVATSEHVARRTIGERRRRVIRSALGVMLVAAVLVLLTALNRDRQAQANCAARMKQAVEMLQQDHQAWLKNPAQFPLERVRATLGDPWRGHVYENSRFTELAAYARRVGVCCCTRPHARPFQVGVRHVIVFNVREGTYEVKTMSEPAFVDQADDLGLQGVLLYR